MEDGWKGVPRLNGEIEPRAQRGRGRNRGWAEDGDAENTGQTGELEEAEEVEVRTGVETQMASPKVNKERRGGVGGTSEDLDKIRRWDGHTESCKIEAAESRGMANY